MKDIKFNVAILFCLCHRFATAYATHFNYAFTNWSFASRRKHKQWDGWKKYINNRLTHIMYIIGNWEAKNRTVELLILLYNFVCMSAAYSECNMCLFVCLLANSVVVRRVSHCTFSIINIHIHMLMHIYSITYAKTNHQQIQSIY